MRTNKQIQIAVSLSASILLLGATVPAAAQDEAPAAATEAKIVPEAAEMAPNAVKAQMSDIVTVGSGLVAVGDHGIIISSSDGKTWKQSPSPVDVLLNAVFFADDKQGWAVGHDGTIIHSADGGATWTIQSFDPAAGKPYMDVLFLDAKNGFAIGAYGLFKVTQDGGANWADFSDPVFEETQPHLNALTRLGDGSLLLVGEGGLIATSADGKVWRKQSSGYEGSLFAAIPRGPKGAMIIGMRGNAYETADLQHPQWHKVDTGTELSLFGIADLGNGAAAVGGNSGALELLKPGQAPQAIRPPAETGLSQWTSYTGLKFWNGELLALTNQGVKVVYAQP